MVRLPFGAERHVATIALCVVAVRALPACATSEVLDLEGDAAGGDTNSGGTTSLGGTGSGGTSAGGTNSGGTSGDASTNSGGADSGGTSSGGTSSGGTSSGGTNSGGTNSGGTNSGGANTGGTNTGGTNTGGTNTGGTNTGGTNTGGTNTGGTNTGGTNTGGTNTGGSLGTGGSTGSCSDGVKNGAETSVDCGGGTCLPCGFRIGLTIQGAQVSGTLTNFPVLVSMVSAQLAAAARSDGADIFFRDASGTLLNFEVESYTSATGRLTAWVRLPLVNAGTDTIFYVHYGDTSTHWTGSGYNATGVWSNGFTRVWHMQDVANLKDSTGAGNATNNGAANITGLINGATYFDGADNMFASHTAIDGASFTASLWLKRSDTDVDRCVITQGRISSPPNTRQMFHFCYEQDVSPSINNHFRFGFWNDDLLSTNAYVDTTNYEYWVGTFDASGGARELYRNGASEGSDTAGGSLSTGTDPLEYGRRVYWWDYSWRGNLDEVHFSNVPRSGSWVAAEYANQRAGSTFLVLGAQEAL